MLYYFQILEKGENMTPVREKFVNIIENLPYELEEEIKTKKTIDILKDVTQRYVDSYGTDDLSEDDKEIIQSLIGNNNKNDNYIKK